MLSTQCYVNCKIVLNSDLFHVFVANQYFFPWKLKFARLWKRVGVQRSQWHPHPIFLSPPPFTLPQRKGDNWEMWRKRAPFLPSFLSGPVTCHNPREAQLGKRQVQMSFNDSCMEEPWKLQLITHPYWPTCTQMYTMSKVNTCEQDWPETQGLVKIQQGMPVKGNTAITIHTWQHLHL